MSNDVKEIENDLCDYKYLDIKIKSIEMDIEMLQNNINLNAINYNEKLGETNTFNSSLENEVIKEQVEKLQKAKKFYLYKKNKIENALKYLTKEELKLVEMRYFTRPKKSWVEISEVMNIANTHCCTMRLKIIDKIKKYI